MGSLTWPDYIIIAILVLSVLISLVRGFVREAISLVTWVVALWVAMKFASMAGDRFIFFVSTPSLRVAIAFILLLILIIIAGAIINHLIVKAIHKTGLSSTDRLLGFVFGTARGVLLVGVLVLLGNMSAFAQEEAWQQSKMVPWFQGVAGWLQQFLPTKFKQIDLMSSPSNSSDDSGNIRKPVAPLEKWTQPQSETQ